MSYGKSGYGSADTGGIFPLVAQYLPDPRVGDKGNVPEWIPEEIVRARAEDDVDGNGIFDGDRPNMHMGDGIFEDNYSLPGFLARETGLGPSEVIDAQTNSQINVFYPGMWNRQPMSEFVPFPENSGAVVPDAKLTAGWDFLTERVPKSPDWNRPAADQTLPIKALSVKPGKLPDPAGWYKPGTGPRPATAAKASLRGYGEDPPAGDSFTIPTSVKWVGAGLLVGGALAWLYNEFVEKKLAVARHQIHTNRKTSSCTEATNPSPASRPTNPSRASPPTNLSRASPPTSRSPAWAAWAGCPWPVAPLRAPRCLPS